MMTVFSCSENSNQSSDVLRVPILDFGFAIFD